MVMKNRTQKGRTFQNASFGRLFDSLPLIWPPYKRPNSPGLTATPSTASIELCASGSTGPARRTNPSSIINADGWSGYNGLVDIGYGHYRVDHSGDEFINDPTHINGIEGF